MSNSARWLDLAAQDEKMAELAYQADLYNQACFRAQQAGEKCLKAFLLEREGRFPKTHSLLELLNLATMRDESLWALKNDCTYLDQFYVPTRYPDALLGWLPGGEPHKKDAEKAMEAMAEIMKLVAEKLLRN